MLKRSEVGTVDLPSPGLIRERPPADLDSLLLAAGRGQCAEFDELLDAGSGLAYAEAARLSSDPVLRESATRDAMTEIWWLSPWFVRSHRVQYPSTGSRPPPTTLAAPSAPTAARRRVRHSSA